MTLRHLRFFALLLFAANLACHDSPTEPRTPVSALNLDGNWSGTITYDAAGDPGCPVSESFETTIATHSGQFGFAVNTRCRSKLLFDGKIVSDLSDANLMIQIDGQDEEEIVTLGGSATNNRIEASARYTARGYHGPIALLLTR